MFYLPSKYNLYIVTLCSSDLNFKHFLRFVCFPVVGWEVYRRGGGSGEFRFEDRLRSWSRLCLGSALITFLISQIDLMTFSG